MKIFVFHIEPVWHISYTIVAHMCTCKYLLEGSWCIPHPTIKAILMEKEGGNE